MKNDAYSDGYGAVVGGHAYAEDKGREKKQDTFWIPIVVDMLRKGGAHPGNVFSLSGPNLIRAAKTYFRFVLPEKWNRSDWTTWPTKLEEWPYKLVCVERHDGLSQEMRQSHARLPLEISAGILVWHGMLQDAVLKWAASIGRIVLLDWDCFRYAYNAVEVGALLREMRARGLELPSYISISSSLRGGHYYKHPHDSAFPKRMRSKKLFEENFQINGVPTITSVYAL